MPGGAWLPWSWDVGFLGALGRLQCLLRRGGATPLPEMCPAPLPRPRPPEPHLPHPGLPR